MSGITGGDKGEGQKPRAEEWVFNWGDNDFFSLSENILSLSENMLNRFSGLLNESTYSNWNNALRELSSSHIANAAYSLPSPSVYDACKTKGGRSVWSEDGFWRCLFKGESIPSHLKHEFKDYTGFLDYQRDLLRKQRKEDDQRKEQEMQKQNAIGSQAASIWKKPSVFADPAATFPGSDRPRLISEQEAKGKNIVRESRKTEAVTLDDGSLQTRTEFVQYFDDGTALLKQMNDTERDSSKSSSSSSWFWK